MNSQWSFGKSRQCLSSVALKTQVSVRSGSVDRQLAVGVYYTQAINSSRSVVFRPPLLSISFDINGNLSLWSQV